MPNVSLAFATGLFSKSDENCAYSGRERPGSFLWAPLEWRLNVAVSIASGCFAFGLIHQKSIGGPFSPSMCTYMTACETYTQPGRATGARARAGRAMGAHARWHAAGRRWHNVAPPHTPSMPRTRIHFSHHGSWGSSHCGVRRRGCAGGAIPACRRTSWGTRHRQRTWGSPSARWPDRSPACRRWGGTRMRAPSPSPERA
eukprot:6111313-Prymnesium_polylepis.1